MWRPDVLSVLWPFGRAGYLVRLGQASVQLWQGHGRAWQQLGSLPCQHLAFDQAPALGELLTTLLKDLPSGARVQVLADSKWMPVNFNLMGAKPLASQQVQALAKHRFAQVFGEQAHDWDIQTTYVSGDPHALAFACPSALQASLKQAIGAMSGLQPTFSWVWNQCWQSHVGSGDAWVLLEEQDRSLMALISGGKPIALQAAAPIFTNPLQLNQSLQTEALRCGVLTQTKLVHGVSFEAKAAMTAQSATTPMGGLRWQVLGHTEALA
ncbi:MAG: hypothetical protein Q7U28_13120 [Aquabacterium sp.]|nr:hypothetical protein [Aquabacterium sp.]